MRKKKVKDTVQYDCLAYKKSLENTKNTGKCIALRKLYCAHEKCSFYKTREEQEAFEIIPWIISAFALLGTVLNSWIVDTQKVIAQQFGGEL